MKSLKELINKQLENPIQEEQSSEVTQTSIQEADNQTLKNPTSKEKK